MTATPVASGSVANNAAKQFTTPAGVTGTNSLLVFVASSLNGDTISAPGTGTWAPITLPDDVITSSGGQVRAFECLNPASSTVYAWTISSTRYSIGWVLLDGADLSGASMVDVASSLESVAGATHAPPALGGGGLPTAAAEAVIDCLMFRQFNPDASSCTPPASGLSWTELLDFRGNDAGGSGQNVQMAINYAVAGAANTAISTAALNTVNTAEPAMVVRVVIKSASAGGPVTLAGAAAAAAAHTGALSTARPLTVKSTAAAALTGAARVARAVAGRSPAAAHAAGALRAARPVAGKASAASSAAGSLTVTGPSVVALAGTIAAASNAAGAAATSRPLAGRASAAAAITGALTVGTPFTPALIGVDHSATGTTTDGRAAAVGNAGGQTGTTGHDGTLTAAQDLSGGTTATGYL